MALSDQDFINMGATPAGDATGLSDDVFLKMGATPVRSAIDPSDQAFIDMGATPVPGAPARAIRSSDGSYVQGTNERLQDYFPIPELSAARQPTMMESLRANNPFLDKILPTTKAQQWKKRQDDIAFQRQLPQITSQMGVDPEGMRTDQEEKDRVDEIIFRAAQKSGVSEAVIRNALRGGAAGDMALQVGLPLVGTVGGGALGTGLVVAGFVPGPVVGAIAGGAAGAGLADILVQTRRIIRGEQQEFDVGMLGVSTLMGGIVPGPLKGANALETVLAKQPLMRPSQITYASEKFLPEGVNKFLTRREGINRARVSRVAGGMATRGGQGVVLGSGGEALRQLINEGKISEPAKLVEYIPMAAGMGAAFGALEIAAPAVYRAIFDKTPEQGLNILKTVPKTPETDAAIKKLEEMLGRDAGSSGDLPPTTAEAVAARIEELKARAGRDDPLEGPETVEPSMGGRNLNMTPEQIARANALPPEPPKPIDAAGLKDAMENRTVRFELNPEQVQAEAFARGQLPAPEAPGPELSAQAKAMEDKYGFKARPIGFSIAEPALGALTGKVAAKITGQDEETEDEWTRRGFALGMGVNNVLLRVMRKPGVVNTSLGAAAFHGTPHKVKKFSNEKIGTGEGAQVYGYGLYFAEAEKVAEGYRDNLSKHKRRILLDGKEVDMPVHWKDRTPRQMAIQDIVDWGYEATVHAYKSGPSALGLKYDPVALKEVIALKDAKISIAPIPGNLYKVDLNLEPTEILNLDRPLSEQPHIISKLKSNLGVFEDVLANAGWDEGMSGKYVYEELESLMGDPKKASEFLSSIGIKAAQYNDGLSRRLPKAQDFEVVSGAELKKRDAIFVYRLGKTNPSVTTKAMEQGHYVVRKGNFTPLGDGVYSSRELAEAAIPELVQKPTSNYVVFDEGRINILEENNVPFQRLVNWADGVLKDRGVGSGAVNTMDPELMAAMTIKLGQQAKEGAIKFDEWANGMIAQHGEGVTPHLQDIWKTAMTTGLMRSGVMASPSITDKNYAQAKAALTSQEHGRFKAIAREAAPDAVINNAVGDWIDGAENSIAILYKDAKPVTELEKVSAKLGLAGDQKSVLWWRTEKAGPSDAYQVSWPKEVSFDQARQALIDSGLENRTMIETPTGVKAIIFDKERNLGDLSLIHI